ncbi:LytTR family DNA-binding domain-containing protein [Aquimarina sp. 2201CG5-10]|uniref:LytR/AlgR family response regulator transcription factor n=1 Tax=Aquimarina callyspongiae TaxID=3098150 RepID=UPI002AB4EA4C|nr:LytTR family DNA-binding domain-containing protein [Aquimarina sp. 2201CG5-10]MDY8137863.1 LytTR family DNA-binding domain-containing protein [Aquimarina sp. 2201CG5-10]
MAEAKQILTSIIVDDEINARENLRYILESTCKDVKILDEASTVDDAIELIKEHNPQVVFLDIEMPQKNGFQLFEAFTEISFQVVFITAYDSYAIKAFQVAAIDYLLKPVDISLLQNAIKKVKTYFSNNTKDVRLQLLKENKPKISKIAVPYKSDYAIIKVDDIICIQADRMYSLIYTSDSKKYVVSKKLHYYEELFSEENTFIRVHRSWIINTDQILSYSKKDRLILLNDNKSIPVSKGYKQSFETIFIS